MAKITIIGLGAGDMNQLPLGVYRILKNSPKLYLRTKEHPAVMELSAEGLVYQSFDEIYEKHESFQFVYEEISEFLIEAAKQEDIVYAVPGHPLVAEQTVQLLLAKAPDNGIELTVSGGQSFLDAMFQALKIDPVDGFQLLDGTAFHIEEVMLKHHVIIGQVYDQFVASEVKLALMEKLPYDYQVYIVDSAGSADEHIKAVPLYELDREVKLSNLTSLYIPPVKDENILYKEFTKLREIIAILRGPNGCPWDKKQTHESLKKYLIEESYELLEAIEEDDIDHMIEELGDVLLQVMLHAQIGEDEGYFSIADIIEGLSAKMIRRHPHVFGDGKAENETEVLKNWQSIKQEEQGRSRSSILSGIPKAFPNLMRAEALQKKAASVGFDWENVHGAWEKVKEELLEFEKEKANSSEEMKAEFGDILFAFVNIARFYGIDPEDAIRLTNEKFTRRFQYIETRVTESGRDFSSYTLEELDEFWNEAKRKGN